MRVPSSSGTTGKPVVVGYSRADLAIWTECTAWIAVMAGVTHADRVQMAFGIERIGATVFPAGAGNTERHLAMLQGFGTTTLVCTPSYALYLAEVGQREGVDFSSMPLRVGLFGGEPCGEALPLLRFRTSSPVRSRTCCSR